MKYIITKDMSQAQRLAAIRKASAKFNAKVKRSPRVKDYTTKEKDIDRNLFGTYDFENIDDNEIIMDGEKYERQYKIYLENKAIDEIFDNNSDVSSEYSYESE